MSAASSLRSEHQFLCPVCLDVFTDPVTTPCGHNFCKQCITRCWNSKVICECPLCKRVFATRPELNVNTFISEVVAQFRHEASGSGQAAARPGEVPCDLCTGTKVKALKYCLVCLVSYCQTHLEPHLMVPGLKKHQLIEAVENLEGRMCVKHHRPLEMFCWSEQTSICVMCTVLEHKTHQVVPLSEEYEGKKAELMKTEAEIQQMIQERRAKIKEIRECLRRSNAAANREEADGVALMECVEKVLKELMDRREEEEKARVKQAGELIKDLEKEICELMRRSSEVEQLLRSEDQVNLLQGSASLEAAPPTKDWTEVSVRPSLYDMIVMRAVAEALSDEMKKRLPEAELRMRRQFAVDVTLDPQTAHPKLILSHNKKQVSHGDMRKKLRNSVRRFSSSVCVLGKEAFSSGKSYFEVEVKGKTDWLLGVSRESVNRKGAIMLSPDEGFWLIWLQRRNQCSACESDADVELVLGRVPDKLGVFVDYEKGLVSFCDVDTAALIYSFNDCRFNGKLLPFFSPCNNKGGENAAPLVICPVDPPD